MQRAGYNIRIFGKNRVKMYECFNCGVRAVIWDSDFDYEDYGLEGKGIIHECHCTNCGARITYYIDIEEEEE